LNKRNVPNTTIIIVGIPFGATSSVGVEKDHRFLDTFSSSQYLPVKQGKHRHWGLIFSLKTQEP
jgi:hypothetical protein